MSEWFFLLVCDMLRTEAVQNGAGRASPFVRVRTRAWARTKEVYSRFSLYAVARLGLAHRETFVTEVDPAKGGAVDARVWVLGVHEELEARIYDITAPN